MWMCLCVCVCMHTIEVLPHSKQDLASDVIVTFAPSGLTVYTQLTPEAGVTPTVFNT